MPMDPKDIGRPTPPAQRDEEDAWLDQMDQRYWSEMSNLRDQGKLRAASSQEEVATGVHEARDRTLLAGLIRTAHDKPDLRPLLLPIIQAAMDPKDIGQPKRPAQRDPRDSWMENVDQREHSEMQTLQEHGKLRSASSKVKPGDRFQDKHGIWIVDYQDTGIPDMVTIYSEERGKGHSKTVGEGELLGRNYKKVSGERGQSLLSGLVRLAHANPEFQPKLLPVIREATQGNRTAKSVRDMAGEKVGPWTVKVTRSQAGGAVLRASRLMLPPLTMRALEDAPDMTPAVETKFGVERGDPFANRLYGALLDLSGRVKLSGRVTATIGLSFVPDMDSYAVGMQGKPLKLYPWIDFDAPGKPPENPILTAGDLKKLGQAADKFHAAVVKEVKAFRDVYAPKWGMEVQVRL